jgi:hypothetical protein
MRTVGLTDGASSGRDLCPDVSPSMDCYDRRVGSGSGGLGPGSGRGPGAGSGSGPGGCGDVGSGDPGAGPGDVGSGESGPVGPGSGGNGSGSGSGGIVTGSLILLRHQKEGNSRLRPPGSKQQSPVAPISRVLESRSAAGADALGLQGCSNGISPGRSTSWEMGQFCKGLPGLGDVCREGRTSPAFGTCGTSSPACCWTGCSEKTDAGACWARR